MTTTISPDSRWTRRRDEKQRRLDKVRGLADGVVLPTDKIVAALKARFLRNANLEGALLRYTIFPDSSFEGCTGCPTDW